MRRARGFTLVELLVALFITAILFAMGYGALNQALNSRKQVEEQSARLNAVQQALRVMEQDFELLQPRPVRDPLGNGYLNPLVLNTNVASSAPGRMLGTTASAPVTYASQQALALLGLTRGSWANPAGLPRSEMQRVSYLLRDGKLVRQHLPVLDATGAALVEERELLDQVEVLSFRFMDGSLHWYDAWPTPLVARSSPQEQMWTRPVAIEVTIRLKDWGTLVRVIEVAS